MRFRRRRRRPVVWLKNTGSTLDSALPALEQASFAKSFATMTFAPGSPTTLVEIPLVLDNPEGVAGSTLTAASLAQLQTRGLGSEMEPGYKLLRVVGDLHVAVAATSSADGSNPGLLAVTAALIVRRVDSATGLSVITGLGDSLPDVIGNIDDPFIWRRMWILRTAEIIEVAGTTTIFPNAGVTDQTRGFQTCYNRSNNFGTGMNNTVSMDAKTRRRIGPEERLFLDVAFTHFGSDLTTTQQTLTANHMIVFDYRTLGTLNWNVGNRRNASR